VLFPVYVGTTQEALHRLLLHKVAVSQAADGLDAESALAAAGVGVGSGLEALAVGRQLFAMLDGRRRRSSPARCLDGHDPGY
jgi:hypothetical protein